MPKMLCACRASQHLQAALQQQATAISIAALEDSSTSAAASSGIMPAAAAAAAHLAVFFPLPELLSLTHEALRTAQSGEQVKLSFQTHPSDSAWVTQLALTLTEAVIKALSTVTAGNEDSNTPEGQTQVGSMRIAILWPHVFKSFASCH